MNDMKSIVLPVILMLFSFLTEGQIASDKNEIEATIARLFEGMKKGDSALLRTAFANQVTMATISRKKDETPSIKQETGIADFLKAVGTPHPEAFNEPIWNLVIQIDGDFAQAWANYAFYLGNKFNHCGVDAFQLFKGVDRKWKIFHLTDTRKKEGCDVPKKVASMFK